MNAAEEPGRRATAQRFHNYQQQLHKQHCGSIYLESLSHLCTAATAATQAQNEHVHTLEKTSYLLSSADSEHDAC